MCRFHAPGVRRGCLEPVADEVNEKERANFCGYFEPAAGLGGGETSGNESAKSELAALFGLEDRADSGSPSSEDEAKRRLQDLFGLDD